MEMQHPSLEVCPCDVTLIAKGGKEFRAHRSLLSEASPFFDRLLKSDMKENREGVIRLEHFSESLMKYILDFIYTGHPRVSLENAEELVVAADFLLLPDLVSRNLTLSSCMSIFYFAQCNHSENLLDETLRFIHSNFANVAISNEFKNLSTEEVEKWITVGGTADEFSNIVKRSKKPKGEAFGEMFPLVIVTCGGDKTFCYLPSKAKWYRLASSKYRDFKEPRQLVVLKGNIYNFSLKIFGSCFLRLNPWSKQDQWVSLPLPGKMIPEMVTVLGDVVYGVGSKYNGQVKIICKYHLHSNSWEAIHSSETVDLNRGSCMVGQKKCLYFMGGMPSSTLVIKFDTLTVKWKKVAHMQQGRYNASGTADHGKIYIAGGRQNIDHHLQSCEVYDVATDDWQFIANLNVPRSEASMVCYLGTLYVLGGLSEDDAERALTVECYDQQANKWNEVTTIPSHVPRKFQACLLTIYKGYLESVFNRR